MPAIGLFQVVVQTTLWAIYFICNPGPLPTLSTQAHGNPIPEYPQNIFEAMTKAEYANIETNLPDTHAAIEKLFVEALFYMAFGVDVPLAWEKASDRHQHYLNKLGSMAKKLTIAEMHTMINIADGVDYDGSTLRAENWET
jgi:type 1 glutamine amidotransferase